MKTIATIILATILFVPGASILHSRGNANASETAPPSNPKDSDQISQTVPPDPFKEEMIKARVKKAKETKLTAKKITVRVIAGSNGGSGVLIAQKGGTYLVLTNAHVVRHATQIKLQTVDGKTHTAKLIKSGANSKYDLALLQFSSDRTYQLADLSNLNPSGSIFALNPTDKIYSAGFPFDSKEIGISSGNITQLSDIPFDNGTQIGYVTNQGEKGIRQGMSGGPILSADGKLLGINTIGVAPILPNYTYNNGSKPVAKLAAKYREANWGIPVYNFLTNINPDILYRYANFPKVESQSIPTGYLAKLNNRTRQMTVRIEAGGTNGSGVIIAKEGDSYYVLTAKHVVFDIEGSKQLFTDTKIITYDRDIYQPTSTVVATANDLAIVKFTSNSNYAVAQLSNARSNGGFMFVGGFPARENIKSPLWQWQLNSGITFDRENSKLATQDDISFTDGYDLIYTNVSYGGMSGGPIFDTDGKLMGIHGRAESTDLVAGEKMLLGRSLGISTQKFMELATELKIDPRLLTVSKQQPTVLSLLDLKTVAIEIENIPKPQAEDSGDRWLAYGNQLYRTFQFNRSIVAFDKAILKGEVFRGNYGKSISLFTLEKSELAGIAIEKAIAAFPANTEANYYYFWQWQSTILQRLGKYDRSLVAIENAIKLKPDNRILLNQKAIILGQQKKYALSIAIFDQLIKTESDVATLLNRGSIKLASGDKQGAIADIDRAITINPNYAGAYNNRADAKSASGDYLGAIADCEIAIKLDSSHAQAYHSRGKNKYKSGDKKRAIVDYTQAIKLNPVYTLAYLDRGTAKYKSGDKQGAIVDYTQVIKLNPKLAEFSYIVRGGVKYSLDDFAGAIADYSAAIKINPKAINAYSVRGIAKYQSGDKQGAIADYTQAIEFDPNNIGAYLNRGAAKYELGDKQGAIADYTQAIEFDPKNIGAYLNRGVAKYDLGDQRGAIADYNLALQINPNLAEAYSSRGVARSSLGDKGAIADSNLAVQLSPKNAEIYYDRAMTKFNLGDKQNAIADYNQAIQLNPKFAQAYYDRGITRADLGDKQAAIRDLNKAAELARQQGKMDLVRRAMRRLRISNK
jgi:tetratricopeptide (TPR) repeat protein/S1-C subfamily serine protease